MAAFEADVHPLIDAALFAPADGPDKHGLAAGADQRSAAVALARVLALPERAQIVAGRLALVDAAPAAIDRMDRDPIEVRIGGGLFVILGLAPAADADGNSK